MQRILWLTAAGLALLGAVPLPGQTTRPVESPTTWPALSTPATQPASSLGDPDTILADLANPDWHVRRRAKERLVDAGPEAEPFIQLLIERAASAEARKNAMAALSEIDGNRLLGTSYITLHLKDASPAEAFSQISRQCFAPLQTIPENLWQQQSFPKLTLDVDHQPFWEVVPKVCEKLGVCLRPYQNGMRIMQGGMQDQSVSRIDGPFLIVANQLTYSKTRAFAGGGEQSQFGMNVSIYPEPKLSVLHGSGSIEVDEAVDDHGNSLAPRPEQRTANWGGYSGYGGWSLYAPLEFPRKNPGSKLLKFRGTTRFVVQTESQKIDIPDIQSLNRTTKVIHGMRVTFQDLKKSGDGWQLRIHVDQPGLGGPDWQQFMEGVQGRMQLLDSEGTPLNHRGMSTSSNNSAVELTLDFGRSVHPDGHPGGDPTRLAWEVPTKTRILTVSIQFKDLPLFDNN